MRAVLGINNTLTRKLFRSPKSSFSVLKKSSIFLSGGSGHHHGSENNGAHFNLPEEPLPVPKKFVAYDYENLHGGDVAGNMAGAFDSYGNDIRNYSEYPYHHDYRYFIPTKEERLPYLTNFLVGYVGAMVLFALGMMLRPNYGADNWGREEALRRRRLSYEKYKQRKLAESVLSSES